MVAQVGDNHQLSAHSFYRTRLLPMIIRTFYNKLIMYV